MREEILVILQETRPESNFSESEDFIVDGLLDSFDMVILIGELEDRFDVVIDGENVIPSNFKSLETIAALIGSSHKRQ